MRPPQRAAGLPSAKRLLVERGILPDKRFGQNFLVDGNMRDLLLRAADVREGTLVLEIGAGIGLFTSQIADLAGRVVAVEIDRRLAAIAREMLEPYPHVRLLVCDALADDRETIRPEVRAALEEALALGFPAMRVLSNLPYGSAATLIVALLESGLPIDRMILTVQREVAERIAAKPGERENGVLSLLVQRRAEARILRRVPPGVFWPRPAVTSAILELAVRREPLVDDAAYPRFKRTVEALFRHPRKTLLNSLCAGADAATRAAAEAALKRCGVDPLRRPQTLSVPEAARIADTLP